MTREEQLRYCKVCKNQKFDSRQGIVCSLTNEPANFELSCSTYNEDWELMKKVEVENFERKLVNSTASASKRFANHILDSIFFMIFSVLFGVVLGVVVGVFAPSYLYVFEDDSVFLQYFLGFIAGMVYYSILEVSTGRTIGKFITKTKVVDENGNIPGFGTILVRSACRFIPFEAFSFLGSEASGWHDKISNTKVIEL